MPFLYHILSSNSFSIPQLLHALQCVIIKHQSLRTSLHFDMDQNMLMQTIIDPKDDHFLFTYTESVFNSEQELDSIMHDERSNANHFNLTQGLAFRCHLLHRNQRSHDNSLRHGDAIILNFHHALFDFASMDIFLSDLNQAYKFGSLSDDQNTCLRYLDCKYSICSHPFSNLHRCFC